MARYQIPPDPRQSDLTNQRPRHQRNGREPIPWLWLLMGVLVTFVSIGVAYRLANRFLERLPLPTTAVEPTVIILTAPASLTPSPTQSLPTSTPIPTFTAVPTIDIATPPAEITIGYYAVVANTAGIGVTVRGGPSVSNVSLLVAPEGTLVSVLDGPREADNFLWWQIRLDDGTEGWVAGSFLEPASPPTP